VSKRKPRKKLEARLSSETSVEFYLTTRHYNPVGRILHSYRCENLKFRIIIHGTPQQTGEYKIRFKGREHISKTRSKRTKIIGRYIRTYTYKEQKVDGYKGASRKDKKELLRRKNKEPGVKEFRKK
jgi:hypothetical protein